MAVDDDKEIRFEVVEHTADWSLRVYGRDLSQLMENAALGMAYLLVEELEDVPLDVERTVSLEAFDAETLLVDWLSELAYWAEGEGLVFREFELDGVTKKGMSAVVRGGKAAELQKHIKAVTYHDLDIVETDEGLAATIVFDV